MAKAKNDVVAVEGAVEGKAKRARNDAMRFLTVATDTKFDSYEAVAKELGITSQSLQVKISQMCKPESKGGRGMSRELFSHLTGGKSSGQRTDWAAVKALQEKILAERAAAKADA